MCIPTALVVHIPFLACMHFCIFLNLELCNQNTCGNLIEQGGNLIEQGIAFHTSPLFWIFIVYWICLRNNGLRNVRKVG